MIAIEIDKGKLKELRAAVAKAGKSFPGQFASAINATAKAARSSPSIGISQKIRTELVVKAGDLNKLIKISRKATPSQLVAGVTLAKTNRLSLKAFNPRQTKAGVTYRISKGGGRKTAPGAFMGPKPGKLAPGLNGHVFRRVGKSRLPINKLWGVSPWGVFVKKRMTPQQVADIKQMLTKQMDRRIRENILRANGIIPSRK